MGKKALLIVGSSRKTKNTYNFAKTFIKSFEKNDVETDLIFSVDHYGKMNTDTVQRVNRSDIIGFMTPLYADYMPAHMLKFIEMLSERNTIILKDKILFGLSQCAFPYWKLNINSIKAMGFFAEESEMHFAGGLAYGGAGLMDGESLEELGKRGEKLIRGIDLAVDGILKYSKIPEAAQELFIMKIPKLFSYPMLWFVNYNTKKIEKTIGKDIEKRAYWE